MSESPKPTEVSLHKQSRTLELQYGEKHYSLTAEYLRVNSPSAEVKGHGPGQEVLQVRTSINRGPLKVLKKGQEVSCHKLRDLQKVLWGR